MRIYEYQRQMLNWFYRQNKDTALFAHETNFWYHLIETYKDNLMVDLIDLCANNHQSTQQQHSQT